MTGTKPRATTWTPIAPGPRGWEMKPARLSAPADWPQRQTVRVCPTGDLFAPDIAAEDIATVLDTMARHPRHVFEIVTRHPSRASRIFTDWPAPANVWVGVEVQDQAAADERVPGLLTVPDVLRFVSADPLCGPVDLRSWLSPTAADAPRVGWVTVCGGIGEFAKPVHPAWVRSLRDQAHAAGVPFRFDRWGEWGPAPFVVRVCDPAIGWQGSEEELEAAKKKAARRGATHVHTGNSYQENGRTVWEVHRIQAAPWSLERAEPLPEGMEAIRRWGIRYSGRSLDGATWDERPPFPEVPRGVLAS